MVLVLLPPERARLAESVLACGAVPVIDLTLGPAPVPRGAGVRVATSEGAPGDGPVLARGGAPLPGRACWKEQGDGAAPGPGWAGIYLRGLGSGGFGGEQEVEALLATVDPAVPVLVDWPHPPEVDRPAATGLVLSDVLFGLLEPGPGLRARLDHLAAVDLRRLAGHTFVASLASPALRRLAAGEPFEEVAAGYFGADDAFLHAWPGGAGLLHARALARRHGSLASALAAYGATAPRPVVTAATPPAPPAPTPDAAAVVERTDGEPIAIVGLGCRLPRAPSPARLWEGLVSGFDAVIEVPRDRWDPSLYWDADRAAPDKSYAKIGAFITDFQFNPRRFRIPPASARLIDPIQQMALEAAADALEDAGLGPDQAFDRERCAVILGNSMGGEITNEYTLRIFFPALRQALTEVPGFAALPADTRAEVLAAYEAAVKRDLPPVTEDSMPGELSNVVAGRIANALNLGGPNFTTDAACAGSMAAVQAAVKGLQDGDFDVAVTGGADRSMAPPTYIKFCKIGALSPDGSRPFDAGANGFVMGEGTGIVVLKRLSDALRDGDRVYAVIRSVGASSDGKGKGITAPNPEGQKRALRRAYLAAGVDPADVDLFECHGTSTIVGDKVEVEALSELVGDGARRARGAARIGSIKSNLGHLKAAAGAASLLKAALALHHRVLPPSIHYQTPRKDLPLERVPLQVQTRAEAWEPGRARFVGVSAFGFGGTNFHVVLEGADTARPSRRGPPPPRPSAAEAPTEAPAATPAVASAPPPPAPAPVAVSVAEPGRPSSAVPVPAGLWALSADSPEELIAKARALKRGHVTAFEPDAPLRCVAAAASERERDEQVEKVIGAVQKGKGYDLVRARGIALEDVPCDGQLAFLFTGQGSQYIDMGLDLAAAYPVVAETFREADAVMTPVLGRPLTDYIRRDPSLTEDEQFDALRATEISQPATLTVDVAILRLFAAFGVQPDVVAGHSLGEYGAAVAAGMLDFPDALRAVSARGREMAAVKLEDFGKMAGIATSVENVEAVLAEIPGYVVAANKNCPTQTVIAGESDAVDAATEAFKSRGITVYPLPVSHAFHSRIVAPASAPLRRVLEGLDLREPRRRITTNVDSRYYPTGPGAREKAIDILARQVASPVEWIAQVERMYADGARIFVECGPKRALTGFVVSILKHRPHRALYTNQPKRGGVLAFQDALAALLALGFPVRGEPGTPELFAPMGERRSTTPKLQARARTRAEREDGGLRGAPGIEREILKMVSQRTGYPLEALDVDFELESDLGIDTVKQADLIAAVRDHFQMEPDPAFRMGEHRTLRSLIDYASQRLGAARPVGVPARRPAQPEVEAVTPTLPADALTRFLAEVAQKDLRGLDAARFAEAMLPALQGFLGAAWGAFQASAGAPVPAPAPVAAPASPVPVPAAPVVTAPAGPPAWPEIVCSGAALGLPAGEEVFAPDNVRRILRGENRIVPVPLPQRERLVSKGLVRLVKNPKTGEGEFVPVDSPDQVIRLAGIKARFDLAGDYAVDPALVRSLDITTQLAFAAGLEALRDAGIPLVRTFKNTSTGKSVATGWALPPSMRDTTGIVFASAFPGYDQLIQKLRTNGDDGEGRFDRRFLFQILAMGHSQFAQFVGARGPNTQINAACASTTQALAIAQDWIRVGRCERVIVLGADDVTNPNLIEWIGAGFLAAGAATTEDKVENAALPFDRRRHGMILGMGAVALVVETAAAARARGVTPIAKLLATRISNSAFHGTRLDPEHISAEVKAFVRETLAAAGVDAERFARRCVFLSHETYTPARGGSAAAEMASLPAAFGPVASKILIANTKGFTGHAMGAGIEDAVAVKALEYQEVPPIANLKEPDPDLGDLTLSRGGPAPVDYALRLAAGFGSQLALAAWQRVADSDRRVDGAAHAAWLAAEVGPGREVVEHRQLRYVAEAVQEAPARPAAVVVDRAGVLQELLATIARRTGYAVEEVDPAYELEADLGIDTVKQAEIFGEVRERYGLARDDSFRLADYPTVEKLAGWLADRVAAQSGAPVAPVSPAPVPSPEPRASSPPPQSPKPQAPSPYQSPAAVLDHLLTVISRRTGYAVDEIDPAYELEADLGIDTVKQAEIFGEVREHYGLARDDAFRLADYPTVEKLAGWLADRVAARAASPASALPATPAPASPPPASNAQPPASSPSPKPQAPSLLHPLPPSIRVRRPVFVARPLTTRLPLTGRAVRVLGEGPLATAVAEGAVRRGARLAEAAEVVIDVGAPVLEGFRVARALNASPPARWLAVTVDGGDLGARRDAGARAGLAKALGREWTGCRAAVLELAEADAEAVLDEAEAADGALEARFDGGRRVGLLALVPDALEPLGEGGVALLTGGTRGITARVARSLATTARWTLVLAARSRPGDAPLDEERARAEIKARLGADGARVTPRRIEDALKPLRVAEEARRTVEELRALGATVEVETVDLADTHAVRALVARLVDRFGGIDLCVHGAGVEESRLLADKDEAAFHRVYDGKAIGGLALAEALPASTWFVSMGSVAGRLGNPGQVDYAAANEAMARVCRARPRSLHVAWTAWADTGMAVRGGMDKLLGDRGVELLPAEPGADLVQGLVRAGVEGEVLVAGRLGDFPLPAPHPLLDHARFDGAAVVATRTLSLATHPWLADHAINGVPVLPGVMGLEWMAAAAWVAAPADGVHGFADVRFAAPCKLHRDEPVELEVRAEPGPDGVRCTLASTRTGRTGRVLRTEHFSALVRTTPAPIAPLRVPRLRDEPDDAGAIYRRFFHGPRFQVLRGADGMSVQGLRGAAEVHNGDLAPGLLTDPLVLEAAFQLAGLHRMKREGVVSLPSAIAAVERVRPVADGEPLALVATRRGEAYDIDVEGPAGAVLRVRGFVLIELGPLDPQDRWPVPEGGWPSVATGSVAEADELAEAERAWLSGRGTPKRVADRLAGQVAARRAVAALVDGPFEVRRRESGEPEVPGADVRVSLSHQDGEALAIASRGGPFGVDVETVEPRAPGFVTTWFRETEHALLADDAALTRAWAAKEAALKALGTGMALSPLELELTRLDAEGAELVLHGEARARGLSRGGATARVRFGDFGADRVVAVAHLLADCADAAHRRAG